MLGRPLEYDKEVNIYVLIAKKDEQQTCLAVGSDRNENL